MRTERCRHRDVLRRNVLMTDVLKTESVLREMLSARRTAVRMTAEETAVQKTAENVLTITEDVRMTEDRALCVRKAVQSALMTTV